MPAFFYHSVLRACLFAIHFISLLLFGLFTLVEADTPEDLYCENKVAIKYELDNCPYSIDWEPNEQQFKEILMAHERWLDNEEDSDMRGSAERAVLCNAFLGDIRLERVDLRGADLRGVSFHETKLRKAKFQKADLRCAKFKGAMLENVNLKGADLRSAEFKEPLLIHCNDIIRVTDFNSHFSV